MTTTKLWMIAIGITACFQQAFSQTSFNNCSAAFLNHKLVVNEYSPRGYCELPKEATGTLTVCTADLSSNDSYAVDCFSFMIAIRDQNTKTMCMYSSKSYKKIDIAKVMAKCKRGDLIVLITLREEYALPHNEILVK